MAEELIEWIKLPQDLQHKFFHLAEGEARRLREDLERLQSTLRGLRSIVSRCTHELKATGKVSTVAAVDSSRSPKLSERLGVRYGLFASGILHLKGEERREHFEVGLFKRRQALSQESSRFLFDILTAHRERRLAVEALPTADLVIIDGSFHGFLYRAYWMKSGGLYGAEEERLVKETVDYTRRLIDSRKAVAVIKRSHTRALAGYLAFHHDNLDFVSVIDKLTLSLLMRKNSWFNYEELVGERPVEVYTQLARMAVKAARRGEFEWPEADPLKAAEAKAREPFEKLHLDYEPFRTLKRIQVKAYPGLPPCEIEFPSDFPRERVVELVGQPNFFNEATNLPLALDLVDNVVGIPLRFTEEFVNEVEGRVLESLERRGESLETVRTFFTLLNPQKPY